MTFCLNAGSLSLRLERSLVQEIAGALTEQIALAYEEADEAAAVEIASATQRQCRWRIAIALYKETLERVIPL